MDDVLSREAILSSRLPEADAPGNAVTHLGHGQWQFGLPLILIIQDANISMAVGGVPVNIPLG